MFEQYQRIVSAILCHGVDEVNQRTGVRIRSLGTACSISIDCRTGRLPLPGNRRVYPATAAAEAAWMLMGHNDVAWLSKHCKIWDKFAEPDGSLRDAYGYRQRRHFGRDQVALALEALRLDPTNRRVYVSNWDPAEDGLGAEGQRTVPCPVGFSLNVQHGDLHMALFIRSSDVFVGLPYDVMGHALLLDAFARELDVGPGTLHVTLAHPHLYDHHFSMAEEGLRRTWAEMPEMPGWSVAKIVSDPDGYVSTMFDLANKVRWPDFNPKPEVVL